MKDPYMHYDQISIPTKRDYARAFALDLYPWLIRAIGCMIVSGSLVFGSIAGFTAAAKSFGVKKECRK